MQIRIVLSLIRHLMTAGGGVLVGEGVLSDGDLQSAVGSVITLIGIVWSIYNNYSSHKEKKQNAQ